MILNEEQLRRCDEAVNRDGIGISRGATSDLLDTIANLKRQLAERDLAVTADMQRVRQEVDYFLKQEGIGGLVRGPIRDLLQPSGRKTLDAYVQEHVKAAYDSGYIAGADSVLLKEQETIADLKRQLAEQKARNDLSYARGYGDGEEGYAFDAPESSEALDAYVQEQVDRAVLAESEWWLTQMTLRGHHFDLWAAEAERLAANRAKVKA